MRVRMATLAAIVAVALIGPSAANAQDWFKTGTGLGVTKARVAAPEFGARTPDSQTFEKTFHDVLWSDLEYSGILEMVSPSFYPTTSPTEPKELKAADWANAPANAYMVAFGNLSGDSNGLAASGYLSDVHNPNSPLALQKIYRGAKTDA